MSSCVRHILLTLSAACALPAAAQEADNGTRAEMLPCAERAARIEALKVEMRTIGQAAQAQSEAQVAVSGGLAGTAMAGQLVSRVVGPVGQVITDLAVSAERHQARRVLASGEARASDALDLARQIADLSRQQREACPAVSDQ